MPRDSPKRSRSCRRREEAKAPRTRTRGSTTRFPRSSVRSCARVSSGVGARRGERPRFVAALATRRRDADALAPLLETLVRAARGTRATRGDGVDEDDESRSVCASAGARGSARRSPRCRRRPLATARVWRLLVGRAPARKRPDARAPTPLMSAVGRALARVSKSSEQRRDELCGTIESKLNGSRARARGFGVARRLCWRLPSDRSRCRTLRCRCGGRCTLRAQWTRRGMWVTRPRKPRRSHTGWRYRRRRPLVAAARYLAPADLAADSQRLARARLRAQALVWRSGDAAGAPVCTVREHARVLSGERLPLDTISALFHADLVLTARVD